MTTFDAFDAIHAVSALANALHVLAAVVWVGGMFFAYVVLRPAVGGIEPAGERLKLWARVFPRFFAWVWVTVIVLPITGYWRMFMDFGGFARAGLYVHAMQILGWVMIGLFVYLFAVTHRRFQDKVAAGDIAAAGVQLAQIRRLVGTNLALGLIVSAIAAFGRLWV
ncbi:MAG: CopD family protein [Proteobacteria bacterium]|nr:CopD family protein [Pseudomonadota bacterium]